MTEYRNSINNIV